MAGLLLAGAAVTRGNGAPELVAVLAVLLIQRAGWRNAAALVAAFALPVLGYLGWFAGRHGDVALTTSDGMFLWSRTMSFANCAVIKPPAALRPLCPGRQPGHPAGPAPAWSLPALLYPRTPADYLWAPGAWWRHDAHPGFTPANNALAMRFALTAIRAEPVGYLRTVASGVMTTFLATDRSLAVRSLHFTPVPDVRRLYQRERRHLPPPGGRREPAGGRLAGAAGARAVRGRVPARPRRAGHHHARLPARDLVRWRLGVLPVQRAAAGPGKVPAVRLRDHAAGTGAVHSFALVTAVQHLLGLAVAVMIYALLCRHGLPGWGATLATLPVLFSAYQLGLEQEILPSAAFGFGVMLAITLVLWWRGGGAWIAAGLVLAVSATFWPVGLPLLVLFGLYLVVRRAGWRVAAAAAAAAAVPLGGYLLWFDGAYGRVAFTDSDGIYLWSRTMSFANCSLIKPPPGERG
jgi:hypothetical protein